MRVGASEWVWAGVAVLCGCMEFCVGAWRCIQNAIVARNGPSICIFSTFENIFGDFSLNILITFTIIEISIIYIIAIFS